MRTEPNSGIGRLLAVLVALYWGDLLVATHLPMSGGTPRGWDKVLHFGAYAALAFLLMLACRRGRRLELFSTTLVGISAVLYGAIDECMQSFVPGRQASLYDWIADTAGVVCGLAGYAAFSRLGTRSGKAAG